MSHDEQKTSRRPVKAARLDRLPPYLFDELDKAKKRAVEKGARVIDLAVGDPDLPTPARIVEKMKEAVGNPTHHRYPGYVGSPSFRRAIASWFKVRFGVTLDADHEVLVLIGSKEGLGHLPMAVVNDGETVLVPDPGYPVYENMSLMAGAEVRRFGIYERTSFLPDMAELEAAGDAKLMFMNYPNNPTGAVVSAAFFESLVGFARRRGVFVCNDAAYSELTFDGFRSPSILAAEGAMDCAIEVHSFSKTFNMTGWRVGFAVGNREILKALAQVKVNLDSSVFGAVQEAAEAALGMRYDDNLRAFDRRRSIALAKLREMGCHFFTPGGTFFVWARVPEGMTSMELAVFLLERVGVTVAPGSGFGRNGEGWFRVALTRPDTEIAEGLERIAGLRLWTS
ncbi:MAG: aminotransferase class I/II-fold pyridoxal phosphate-dependent enzyme [Candidatus Eisenbacteria bacterium]|nr:aminotransferase class I/II-fold pyridoxal phosphate-dependent enzyme [Candidatus Eisenbacteria bacterium]